MGQARRGIRHREKGQGSLVHAQGRESRLGAQLRYPHAGVVDHQYACIEPGSRRQGVLERALTNESTAWNSVFIKEGAYDQRQEKEVHGFRRGRGEDGIRAFEEARGLIRRRGQMAAALLLEEQDRGGAAACRKGRGPGRSPGYRAATVD